MKQFIFSVQEMMTPPPYSSIPLGNLNSGSVCNKYVGLCLFTWSSLILTNIDLYQWIYLNGKQKITSPDEHF